MKKLFILLWAVLFFSGCGKAAITLDETVISEPTASAVLQSTDPAPTQKPSPSASALPKATHTPKPTATSSPSQSPEEKQDYVKISIIGYDGNVILPVTEVIYKEGQTVLGILLDIAKERKIQTEYSGGKKNAYIKGINNLYEFDKGATSGWRYSINGEYPKKSCGSYIVKNGDVIEWKYSLNINE